MTSLFSRSGVLGSDVGDPASTFSGLDDRSLATAEIASSLDGSDPSNWERNFFSPISLVGPVVNTAGDQDPGTANTNGSLSTTDDEDPVSTLSSQLTALNARTMHAMRSLMRPGSMPPTVNSPLVNEAFEATFAIIRIINSIPEISTSSPGGDQTQAGTTAGQSTTAFGLVFQVLASHQHLLGLLRAICDSVERCLESITLDDKQQQRGLHGDGPSSAQFVMVLQLVMHLIGRMDRSLFSTTVSFQADSHDAGTQELTAYQAGAEARHSKGSQCIPVLAQTIARALPGEHAKLQRVVQTLLTRIEGSNIL